MKEAYFAGGCFWCIAAAFAGLEGVEKIIDGYSGGSVADPTYLEVKSQTTGHRETIKVLYREEVVDYEGLLDFFFDNVDPFDPDGQFIDRGTSYTLALFYQNEEEKESCLKKIKLVEENSGREVCVSLLPFEVFYAAEEEHQDYAEKNKAAFAEEYENSGRKAYFEGREQGVVSKQKGDGQ